MQLGDLRMLSAPLRYGTETLQDITSRAAEQCKQKDLQFESLQTNHEGVMLDRIHAARTDGTSFIVINAGAWTHTSVALVDALSGAEVPFVEVHVSRRQEQHPTTDNFLTCFRYLTRTREKSSVTIRTSLRKQ